jgi:hypothetical protein
LTHTPPPPQSNACGQVKRRTDGPTDRVDTHVIACLFVPLIFEDAHPAPGGFCAFLGDAGRLTSVPLSLPSRIDGRAFPLQPRAWEGWTERAEKIEHEQAKRRKFLFLPQAQKT